MCPKNVYGDSEIIPKDVLSLISISLSFNLQNHFFYSWNIRCASDSLGVKKTNNLEIIININDVHTHNGSPLLFNISLNPCLFMLPLMGSIVLTNHILLLKKAFFVNVPLPIAFSYLFTEIYRQQYGNASYLFVFLTFEYLLVSRYFVHAKLCY